MEHWWRSKPSVVGNVVCTVQPTILEAMGSRWIVLKLRSSKVRYHFVNISQQSEFMFISCNETYLNCIHFSYEDMYSGNNKGNNLFVRHEANGQDFEFSDDRFGIKARMEGSTYKPILHLSIAPLHNDELGNVQL